MGRPPLALRRSLCICAILCATLFALPAAFAPAALAAEAPPSVEEVAALLKSQPITLETWPAWRARLLAWVEIRNHTTDAAYDAACNFVIAQAGVDNQVKPPLSDDAFAWYLLGSAQMGKEHDIEGLKKVAPLAEKSFHRSLQLNPKFAPTHEILALLLLIVSEGKGRQGSEAEEHLAEAKRLAPDLPLSWVRARAAMVTKQYDEAAAYWQEAVAEEPDDLTTALSYAQALLVTKDRANSDAEPIISELSKKFPQDGHLVCLHGLALADKHRLREAREELHRAKDLGVEPAEVLGRDVSGQIEELGAPSWMEYAGYGALAFVGFYAVVMAVMVGLALILAPLTRGTHALQLAGVEPNDVVQFGRVTRTVRETLLAKVYALLLVVGLVLFYVAVPFVIVGLLGGTAGLLYLILLTGHIPIKLFVIIAIVGLMMAWSVLKSLFVRMNRGGFGIPKTRAEEPKLYDMLEEVGKRVDTRAVDEVYLAPGSEIGVHQTGSGPFGLFGRKNRVLTLGLSSLQFLTADELRSVFAHEYAHFSHGDTFFSRFIYQVSMSIEQSLNGMGAAGGKLNYVNPFFWFIYLYYRAYSMMSAGFSRSREFLADRMAAGLYGANVFSRALTKVATSGSYSESLMYDNVARLMESNQMSENIYSSFRKFEEENPENPERQKAFRESIGRKSSLFASHPTIPERVAAVEGLASPRSADESPATGLLADPVASEKELTQFITGYFHHLRELRRQAAAQAS